MDQESKNDSTKNVVGGDSTSSKSPSAGNKEKASSGASAKSPAKKAGKAKSKPKRKKRFKLEKKPMIAIIVVVVVLVIIGSIAIPVSTSRITKENTVTASQLEDAIAISNLSTAEFIYNGIATKYKEGTEETDYSISYDATCKAGVPMDEITFEIDDTLKIVRPHFPDPVITNISVDINSLSYLPRDPDIDMKEVIQFCENDIREGAEGSEEFKRLAKDNLQDVLEALTMPILKSAGYTIEWSE